MIAVGREIGRMAIRATRIPPPHREDSLSGSHPQGCGAAQDALSGQGRLVIEKLEIRQPFQQELGGDRRILPGKV